MTWLWQNCELFFHGSEYASQARATAADVIHRGHITGLALSYRDREVKYVCETLEDEEGLLQSARATLPFDEPHRKFVAGDVSCSKRGIRHA